MRRLIGMFCVAVFLTGCGTQFVYNNLPLVTPFYVDDYVDLNREQKKLFKARLKSLHQWHRQTELPIYRDLLVQVQATLNEPSLDTAALLAKVEPLEARWDTLVAQTSPTIIEIAATLTPEQIEGLYAAFEARHQERLDKGALDPEEAVQRIEKWMGRLTDEQRRWVIEFEQGGTSLDQQTVDAQRVFQARLRPVLESPGAPDFNARMQTLLLNPMDSPEGRMLEAMREAQGIERLDLLVRLWDSASDTQKRRVNRRLQGYIDDLEALIVWPAAV